MSDCVCVKSKTIGGPVAAQRSALLAARRAAFSFGVVALTLGLAAFELCGGRVQAAETKPVKKIDPVALLQKKEKVSVPRGARRRKVAILEKYGRPVFSELGKG